MMTRGRTCHHKLRALGILQSLVGLSLKCGGATYVV